MWILIFLIIKFHPKGKPETPIYCVTEGSKYHYDFTLRCLVYGSLRLVQSIECKFQLPPPSITSCWKISFFSCSSLEGLLRKNLH